MSRLRYARQPFWDCIYHNFDPKDHCNTKRLQAAGITMATAQQVTSEVRWVHFSAMYDVKDRMIETALDRMNDGTLREWLEAKGIWIIDDGT